MALPIQTASVCTRVSAEPGDGMDVLLTAAEAAAYLRVSQATLWRWCQEGRVPGFKIGHEWRINGPALRQQIAAGEQPNAVGDTAERSAAIAL
jgi:excisionase family DNA binding protein